MESPVCVWELHVFARLETRLPSPVQPTVHREHFRSSHLVHPAPPPPPPHLTSPPPHASHFQSYMCVSGTVPDR